jgi:uncharacterized protein (TIGR03663 family)
MAEKELTTTSECESNASNATWQNFFTPPQWVMYGVLIVAGLLLRWILLDIRPYHHDESLHGMYGRYFYDFPENNYYKYDPMLHGPMLYNSMRFIYAIFGDTLWSARVPVCIMGSLFMVMPFLYRRFFSQTTVLILTATVACSPTLVYWSRFLREDYWVLSGMLFSLYGFALASRSWKAFFVLFGLTIQWCTKESVFVTLAVFAGYPIFEAMFEDVVRPRKDSSNALFTRLFGLLVVAGLCVGIALTVPKEQLNLKVASIIGLLIAWFVGQCILESVVRDNCQNTFAKIGNYIRSNFWQTGLAVFVCGFIFAWFYGAGFRYPQGIIDGLGGKAIDYWAAHHAMERIKGPFNFHVYVMGWYEFPVFVAFLAHIVLFYRRAIPEIRFAALSVLAIIGIACLFTNPDTIQENGIWKPFKLKDNLDIVGLFVLLFHAPLVTINHLLRKEQGLAVTGYFATATFFVYSYLGEKVPWLSVYPLIFALPYMALFYQDYFTRYPVNYKEYPVKKALLACGIVLMTLGIIFIAERKDNDPKTNEDILFIVTGVLLVAIAMLDDYGRYLGRFNVGRWVVAAGVLFSVRAAIQTNFLYGGKETEYLSQVHTTYDLHDVALMIIDDVQKQPFGYKPTVFGTGEATWPLAWYFRNLREEYKFSTKPEDRNKYTYLFIDWKDQREPGDIPDGYTVRKMNLRGWWVPEFKQITLKKFLRYSFNHYPWNTSGFTYTTFLVAKDRARFLNAAAD